MPSFNFELVGRSSLGEKAYPRFGTNQSHLDKEAAIIAAIEWAAYWAEHHRIYLQAIIVEAVSERKKEVVWGEYFPEVDNSISDFDKRLSHLAKSVSCEKCLFYRGTRGIICRLHPNGAKEDFCKDFCPQ